MNRLTRLFLLFFPILFVLTLFSSETHAAPPQMSRDDIICRAKSGVGYSYHWGGACWCRSNCSPNFGSCSAGSCSGSCPGCNHYGTYGADCSGYVTKIWQIPNAIAVNSCGHGPYVASNYMNTTANWTAINRDNIQRGDAFASTTHVLLYESGSPWGTIWAYEAMGCSYGIVHGTRSCGSQYKASRRNNLGSACACTPGQTQTGACGNCGSRKRTCNSSCQWGAWGSCTGQGACAAGAKQNGACGNCGTRTRTCSSKCAWGAWGSCSGQGACAPNEKQSGTCGNCGTRDRTCTSKCAWGSWGSCSGEGPCAPGAKQSRDCCDCGSQTRTCSSACQWGDYSTCHGPDPEGGTIFCDTKEFGPCAEGRIRCVQGCKACVRIYDPFDEICDGIDNDCSGEVDDGFPEELGNPPPPYAASVVDKSVPSALKPGEKGEAWAAFRNDGTVVWNQNEIWLGVEYAPDQDPFSLYDPGAWPAYDVAAILESDVPPGGTAIFSWSVRAPAKDKEASQVFRLMDPTGAFLMCPSPIVEIRLNTSGQKPGSKDPEAEVDPVESTSDIMGEDSGCSCRSRTSTSQSPWLLLVIGLGALARRRRSMDS